MLFVVLYLAFRVVFVGQSPAKLFISRRALLICQSLVLKSRNLLTLLYALLGNAFRDFQTPQVRRLTVRV